MEHSYCRCVFMRMVSVLQSTLTHDEGGKSARPEDEEMLSAILFAFRRAVPVAPAKQHFAIVVLLFPLNITINL